jgi:NlpC/P60 family putative phage cell wall peptidase
VTRTELVAEARSWTGTPWQHQACVKGAGVDCLHFIAGVARAFGTPEATRFFATPSWHSYGRLPDPAMIFSGSETLMDRIDVDEALQGDVFVFAFRGFPMHFGMLTVADRFIHAYATAGRVVEHQLDDRWRKRVVAAYRLRGLE